MLEGRIFDGGRAGDLFRGTLASATQAAAVIGRLQKAKVRVAHLYADCGLLVCRRRLAGFWALAANTVVCGTSGLHLWSTALPLPTPLSYRSLQGASCGCGQTGTKWMQSKQRTQSRQPRQSTGEPRKKRQARPAADVGGLTCDMQCTCAACDELVFCTRLSISNRWLASNGHGQKELTKGMGKGEHGVLHDRQQARGITWRCTCWGEAREGIADARVRKKGGGRLGRTGRSRLEKITQGRYGCTQVHDCLNGCFMPWQAGRR